MLCGINNKVKGQLSHINSLTKGIKVIQHDPFYENPDHFSLVLFCAMSTFYFFQSIQRWHRGKVMTSSFFILITPMISLNLGQNPNLDQTKNARNIEKYIMAPERSGPK